MCSQQGQKQQNPFTHDVVGFLANDIKTVLCKLEIDDWIFQQNPPVALKYCASVLQYSLQLHWQVVMLPYSLSPPKTASSGGN